jgi:PhzF family phenazine biosynthesis protein
MEPPNMKTRPFQQVDVFTNRPYLGNPLAVVLDGDDLHVDTMRQFTKWTNLSEAAFILPPTPEGRRGGADYRVRIFGPGGEMPFAGHPTLGSCHAWLAAGGQPCGEHIVQECGIGLVRVRRDGRRLAFATPALRRSGPLPEDDVALIARGLGVPRNDILHHAWCDNGAPWRAVMLPSAEQVLELKPNGAILVGLDVGVIGPRGKVGVVGPHEQSPSAKSQPPHGNAAAADDTIAAANNANSAATDDASIAFEVRAFFPGANGLAEDPVTGSHNAALAQWLIAAGLAPPTYVARQGTALGRDGRVHVEQDGQDIWIGGGVVTCIDGGVVL